MIIGASTVCYPTSNHTNNNCWRGGNQWLMKMGNLRLFKLCWKVKWVNKIRSPLMLQNVFWCQPLWPLGHVYVTNLDLYRRTGYAIYDKGENKCMTMQLADLWVSKFEGYIERNTGSARQLYSGNIWQTRHAGKNWKVCLRTLSKPLHQHPPLDEFALMLGKLFTGTPEAPLRPNNLTDEPSTLQEFMGAVNFFHVEQISGRMWIGRWGIQVHSHQLDRQNFIFIQWSAFKWPYPFKLEADFVTDFRPVASIRLFYKLFVYMILHKIQACLDNHQPQEQHGFLDDVWKNICSPPTCSSIRPWRRTCQCGSWAWTCQRHLIE